MFSFRRVWWLIAVATAVLNVWFASASLADGGMGSCSKTGSFSDTRPDVQCADSIYDVYGVWPMIWIGLLLVAPSVLAAVAKRWWVSWMTVTAFAALSFYGLAHIAQVQWMLVAAIPLTLISLLVAATQTAVRFVKGPTLPLHEAHGLRSTTRTTT